MINSREKFQRKGQSKEQRTRFVIALPLGSEGKTIGNHRQSDLKVYVEVTPGQVDLYLYPDVVETILALKSRNYSLTIPARLILRFIYQSYLQDGLQGGLVCCGYAWVGTDEAQLFTRTFISLDGDVINYVKRDWVDHPDCLQLLQAYSWLHRQLLRQFRCLLNAITGNLIGIYTISLLIFQGGNDFLKDNGAFPYQGVWLFLSWGIGFWFWVWIPKARSRLSQIFYNRYQWLHFPAWLNSLPCQVISIISIISLLFFIDRQESNLLGNWLLIPFFYHILRTLILPLVSRWLLSLLFSSSKLQQLIGYFLSRS